MGKVTKKMSEEEENAPDGDYSPKSEFSKPGVVQIQVSRCNEVRSKEMKQGYFNFDKLGNRVYIPDARREWISCVNTLRKLLAPEIMRDKDFKKKVEDIDKAETEVFNRWKVRPTTIKENKIKILEESKPFIPELDQPFLIMVRKPLKFTIATQIFPQYVPGLYNENFHGYWREIVEVYDQLFAKLNILIDKIGYFKKGTGF